MEDKPKKPRNKRRSEKELMQSLGLVSVFVRSRRKRLEYTQERLAERSGVSLNFIKSLELGKENLRMDKVNQLLSFFGAELRPVSHSEGGSPNEFKG